MTTASPEQDVVSVRRPDWRSDHFPPAVRDADARTAIGVQGVGVAELRVRDPPPRRPGKCEDRVSGTDEDPIQSVARGDVVLHQPSAFRPDPVAAVREDPIRHHGLSAGDAVPAILVDPVSDHQANGLGADAVPAIAKDTVSGHQVAERLVEQAYSLAVAVDRVLLDPARNLIGGKRDSRVAVVGNDVVLDFAVAGVTADRYPNSASQNPVVYELAGGRIRHEYAAPGAWCQD